MINEKFVKRKISLIQDDLARLSDLARFSFQEISGDDVKQAAVERFLERIVNRAIDINQHLIAECAEKNTPAPKDYTETFKLLATLGVYRKEFASEIAKSVGTRNALTHEYDKVDVDLMYRSITDCLRDYHHYCQYVLEFLEKQKE